MSILRVLDLEVSQAVMARWTNGPFVMPPLFLSTLGPRPPKPAAEPSDFVRPSSRAPHSLLGGATAAVKGDSEALDSGRMGRCCVCLEKLPLAELEASSDVCGSKRCSGCCGACLQQYFESKVASSQFSLPTISCIQCRGRLPCSRWRECVEEPTYQRYKDLARRLLNVRCPACDRMLSLAAEEPGTRHREGALEAFRQRCRDLKAVCDTWSGFKKGTVTAARFVDVLTESGPSDLLDSRPERRIADDGWHYAHRQFFQWYGQERAQREWDLADVYSLARRVARDGDEYTLAEFRDWFGNTGAQARWASAPICAMRLAEDVLPLIDDVERRTALHLAQLRRYPKIWTPCCHMEYCFKCQVGSWHDGRTCEQVLEREAAVEVQFCEGCGVPTQRTEGCSHMICLCGASWTWEGGDDEDDQDSDWDF
mmetsp:Transcript_168280/g.540643  ORF Transcript_168280/g.540643 Transcript_168280/m.540643 type:complete len:425 (-) Transcript_168280:150-1424(-)